MAYFIDLALLAILIIGLTAFLGSLAGSSFVPLCVAKPIFLIGKMT